MPDLKDRVIADATELRLAFLHHVLRVWPGAGKWAELQGGYFSFTLDDRSMVYQPLYALLLSEKDVGNEILGRGSNRRILVITVRLNDKVLQLCRQNGISCVDLWGTWHLRAPGFYVEYPKNPKAGWSTAYKAPDIFSDRSCRVARWLLSRPDTKWTVSSLCQEADISRGLAWTVLNAFRRQGWVSGTYGSWQLVSGDALLEAWRKGDRWDRRVRLYRFTWDDLQPESTAQWLVERAGEGNICFTQGLAQRLRTGQGNIPMLSFYAKNLTYKDCLGFGWRRGRLWGNIWMLHSRDEGVFHCSRLINGLPVVCDAQCYLDQWNVEGSGPLQAEEFRKWKGFSNHE